MARLDIRLDEDIKAKAEKASALLGLKSLTEYVSIRDEANVFDRFSDLSSARDCVLLLR